MPYNHSRVYSTLKNRNFSKELYGILRLNFVAIQSVITRKLQQLDELGFDPSKGHMFGFSFGSHLVLESAYQYGPKKLGRVDVCDPAGPYFVSDSDSVMHAMDAAVAVQCIHTCSTFGTRDRYCQKNINMGRCGHSQPASPFFAIASNHNFCPTFYINAFTNDFFLIPKEKVKETLKVTCYPRKETPNVTLFSEPAKMGYYLDMSIPDGEYYSLTYNDAPYNKP